MAVAFVERVAVAHETLRRVPLRTARRSHARHPRHSHCIEAEQLPRQHDSGAFAHACHVDPSSIAAAARLGRDRAQATLSTV
jgi:hypothetical protein